MTADKRHQVGQRPLGLKAMLFTSLVSVGLFLIVFVIFLSAISLLLSLLLPVRAKELAKPDFTVYHTMDTTLAAVAHLVDSSKNLFIETETRKAAIAEVVDLADGDGLNDTSDTNDGNDRGGAKPYKTTMTIVTYDENEQIDQGVDKNKVLIDFGEHGREVITTETAMTFLSALASPAIRNTILSKFHVPPHVTAELSDTLSRTIIKVIPIENTNGRALVERGHLCERKNGRGVDPNRNWALDWGKKEPDYDPNEEYPGTHPFSEPEAQLLKELAESFRPDMFLNIHSGMEAMFVPWDHRLDVDYGINVNGTLDMLQEIDQTFCGGRCAVGAGGKEVGYMAHGTVTDYMHETLKVPISSTWEIYGDMQADFDDCWRMFNPIGAEEKDEVVDRWVGSLFYAIWYALSERHPVGRAKRFRVRIDGGEEWRTGNGGGQLLVVYGLLVPVVVAIAVGARNMRQRKRRGGVGGKGRRERERDVLPIISA